MKRIGKNTISWKTYEAIFLDLRPEDFPFIYDPGLTFGQAISLAQNLNKCQAQWERETGVPEGFCLKSAKAKVHSPSGKSQGAYASGDASPDYDAPAYVEISASPKRIGQRGNPETIAKLSSALSALTERTSASRPALLPVNYTPEEAAHFTSRSDAIYEKYLTQGHQEPEPAAGEPTGEREPGQGEVSVPAPRSLPPPPEGFIWIGSSLREAAPLMQAIREGLNVSAGLTVEAIETALTDGTFRISA
jgi:hypothetical protein